MPPEVPVGFLLAELMRPAAELNYTTMLAKLASMKNQVSGSITFDGPSLAASLLAELKPLLRAPEPLSETEAAEVLMHIGVYPEAVTAALSRLSGLGVQLTWVPQEQQRGAHAAPEVTEDGYPGGLTRD